MNTQIKILIADDHKLFRKGVISLIENEENILIVGEVGNGKKLVEQYFYLKPDLILADISMPVLSGTEALKKIIESDPHAKALFLSMFAGEEYIYYCYKCGGKGLINKNTSKSELLKAIEIITNGNLYFGTKYSEQDILVLIKKYETEPQISVLSELSKLTQKEEDIVLLIGRGLTSAEIADELNISKRTVDTHRNHLMQKLNLKSLPQLIQYSVSYSMQLKKEL